MKISSLYTQTEGTTRVSLCCFCRRHSFCSFVFVVDIGDALAAALVVVAAALFLFIITKIYKPEN
jgi:hypothetical protein